MPVSQAPPVRLNIHVLALDETTDWTIRSQDAPYIEAILSVKFYNSHEVTYCCEITPSYALHFLSYQIRWTPAGEALRESDPDATEVLQEHYECSGVEEPLAYWHCHLMDAQIERLAALNDFRYHHYGDPRPADSDADYQQWLDETEDPMESVLESLQANSVL